MYFSNSQPSLLFPSPASPTITNRPGLPTLFDRLEELLDQTQFTVTSDERSLQAIGSLGAAN